MNETPEISHFSSIIFYRVLSSRSAASRQIRLSSGASVATGPLFRAGDGRLRGGGPTPAATHARLSVDARTQIGGCFSRGPSAFVGGRHNAQSSAGRGRWWRCRKCWGSSPRRRRRRRSVRKAEACRERRWRQGLDPAAGPKRARLLRHSDCQILAFTGPLLLPVHELFTILQFYNFFTFF